MSGAKMVGLKIDGRPVQAPEGTNVLKAAEQAGVSIPHFCYHPAFEAEGNCRMCLVEVEGLPKLELACSTVVREGMTVWTSTPRVLQARKDVLEFLLAEHPLDCPICDKAGECKLQEYYDRHGLFAGRFVEAKEKRDKKAAIGKGLLLDRERCILCTRCVRFLRKVTGTGELGVFERGVRTEIGIYDGVPVDNNYSGNLVDICPVGAITDADFRFKTRAWFLKKGPTVCPGCSRGCAIVVESVSGYPLGEGQRRIFRIKAGENPAVNGHWICDFGRSGRRDIDERRHVRVMKNANPEEELSWQKALADVTARIRAVPGPERAAKIAVVLNSRLTCEELVLAKRVFAESLGLGKIFFADPKPGVADGFLLTEERVPNARGVLQAGFSPRLPDLAMLAASVEVLLVFGLHLLDHFSEEAVFRALAGIPWKFLFSSHAGPLDRLADFVFPVALPAEKSGTYINVDGLRQTFGRAVEPPPGVVSEREILGCLANGLGLNMGEPDAC
ncbi:MAG: (2Fe-2S)-binding protein [Acidobacteria bacterium]|nr:(2Fe-2S)-binding protein [Acidobacteriota bacterium]